MQDTIVKFVVDTVQVVGQQDAVTEGDLLYAVAGAGAAYGIVPFVDFLKNWIPAKYWFVAPEFVFLILSAALVFNANQWLSLNYSMPALVTATLSMDKLANIIAARGIHDKVVATVRGNKTISKEGE